MSRKVNSKVNRVFNTGWFILGLSLFLVGLLIFCLSTSFPSLFGIGIIITLAGLLLADLKSTTSATRGG